MFSSFCGGKGLGILCHPEERGEEGSRVWPTKDQRPDPSGGETALRITDTKAGLDPSLRSG